MRNIVLLGNLFIFLSLFSYNCSNNNAVPTAIYEIPSTNHNLSYIPFDARSDNPNYRICDSTSIGSGRNRLQYVGGKNKLRKDIASKYVYSQGYETFSGYIVIRFLVNCEGEVGRYRAQSLNLDFSPLSAPSGLLKHSIELIKSLDNWTKSPVADSEKEYSKYINLKINDGKIQHVLL